MHTSPFNPVALLLDNKVGGGLHALNIETGEERWQTPHPGCNDIPGCSPAQSAAVTAISGIVFSGGIDGHLRAYSADDGNIVWDVDTKTEYRAVNDVAARGGSIDGPGAVVVGGTLYVNSGSRFFRDAARKRPSSLLSGRALIPAVCGGSGGDDAGPTI